MSELRSTVYDVLRKYFAMSKMFIRSYYHRFGTESTKLALAHLGLIGTLSLLRNTAINL